MIRAYGTIVRFADPFGEVVVAEEFVLRWDDPLDDVRAAYADGVRVSVDLGLLPPEDRGFMATLLDELVTTDDGELWPLDERSWLLTPRRPREREPEPGAGGPWPSSDREPRTPSSPAASGAAALALPVDGRRPDRA